MVHDIKHVKNRFNSYVSRKVSIYDFSAHRKNHTQNISVNPQTDFKRKNNQVSAYIFPQPEIYISKYKRTLKDPLISETGLMRLFTYIQMPVIRIKFK